MRSYAKPIALATLALGLSSLAFASDFEGVVEVTIVAKGETSQSTVSIKGSKVRVDSKLTAQIQEGVEGYPVIDFEARKITMISPKDKYYLDMGLDPFLKSIDAVEVAARKSGKKQALLGCEAEEWVGAADAGAASIWATKQYSPPGNLFVSLQKLYPSEGLLLGRMAKAIIAQGYMPLKAVVTDKQGKALLDWELVSMTPKSLEASAFAIPSGYGKMSDVLKKSRKAGGR
jgi:hypothetical protein